MPSEDTLPKEIDNYITPLIHTSPRESLADLKFLKEKLGDRKFVGLGEATHGTKEFFDLKHRLTTFLAEEANFKTFIWEASFSETLNINRYVVSGEGDAEELVDNLSFGIWHTEEILNLVEGVREYNRDRLEEDRIRFHGFDLNREFPASIRRYLETVDPDEAEKLRDELKMVENNYLDQLDDSKIHLAGEALNEFEKLLESNKRDYIETTSQRDWKILRHEVRATKQTLKQKKAPKFGAEAIEFSLSQIKNYLEEVDQNYLEELGDELESLKDSDFGEAFKISERIEQQLENNKERYIEETSKEEHQRIKNQQLEILTQGLAYLKNPDSETSLELRDRFMAENVERILAIEELDKAVLWGHNGHIQKSYFSQVKAMGKHLEEKYGEDYFSLGFHFGYGSFQAVKESEPQKGMQKFEIERSSENRLPSQLAELGNLFFLDLESVEDSEISDYLYSTHRYLSAGASLYSLDDVKIEGECLKGFDGLIFVEETSRAEPITK